MVGICFYYEDVDVDVWSGKKLDAWNYACQAAGDVDKAIVINKTEQRVDSFDKSIDFIVCSDLEEANLTGHITQMVCPWDFSSPTKPLWDFDHQTDWYILGPANGWGGINIGEMVHVPQAGRGSMHSVHIFTTVMLHRYSVTNK
jgi:hypothetical protein